ncbi:MAG: GMC family oxidoreductase N-terminal domain-containing protein [Gammaproteobacteria bacterium]|nr:GMC family oxidoreductase N-terminal domain-containing protein [Gammaproteobacteria bacterium]
MSGGAARHWLSVGFTDLAARVAAKTCATPDFDVLIVGSGYGGSIAAHHLAGVQRDGKPLSVGVLERGQEYVEGEFPAEGGDLPRHARVAAAGARAASGVLDGLFDLRLGPEVSSLVGNGLGGGSLINAGVMIRPLPEVFDDHWPTGLGPGALDDAFEQCEDVAWCRSRLGSAA